MTDLLIDALASWRLVRLLQRDEITREPRMALTGWLLKNGWTKTRYLIQCPHCLGIWTTAFVLGLRRVLGGHALRNLLAVAGMVSVFSELEPKLTSTDSD